MNEIIVAGIGPGHPDYILPAAARAIHEAKVLVGGRRALAQFARPQGEGQLTMAVTGNIDSVMQFIRENLELSPPNRMIFPNAYCIYPADRV